MSSPRLSRLTLHRARGAGVVRLARFVGIPVGRCACARCIHGIVEELVRRLDATEGRK